MGTSKISIVNLLLVCMETKTTEKEGVVLFTGYYYLLLSLPWFCFALFCFHIDMEIKVKLQRKFNRDSPYTMIRQPY